MLHLPLPLLLLIEEVPQFGLRAAVVIPTTATTSVSLLPVQYADHHRDYQCLCLLDCLTKLGRLRRPTRHELRIAQKGCRDHQSPWQFTHLALIVLDQWGQGNQPRLRRCSNALLVPKRIFNKLHCALLSFLKKRYLKASIDPRGLTSSSY